MSDRVIPNAIILPSDPGGQMTPGAANDIAQASTMSQILVASRDAVIPLTYGGPDRIAGLLYLARVYQGRLVLCIILGEGEVEEIAGDQMNDADLPTGITVTKYRGTQTQTVDPTLAAAIPGFTEAMLGTAYVVAQISPNVSGGFPRFTFLVKGRKLYDPRDGGQSPDDPTTWTWSDNPALALGDFLASNVYGARKSVDWDSVADAADYCDETVTDGSLSEKRALISLTINEKQDVRQWVEALRSYVPAWIDYDGGQVLVIPDMPRASDHTFDSSNIVADTNSIQIVKAGVRDTPNVMQIGYMRTDVTPWAMDYAEAVSGTPASRRVTRIDMPGIKRYGQAMRFAIEKLNHFALEDLQGQLPVAETGLKVLLGDRATVTDDIGLNAKEVRITARQDLGFGRWLIGFREYDPAAYSSTIQTTPSTPNTGLPNPKDVPEPEDLAIVETIYLEKNVSADSLARGLIYQSRFDVNWTAPDSVYPLQYELAFLDGTTLIHSGFTSGTSYASPAVQQGKTYTVHITAFNSLGFPSATVEGSHMAQGKLLPPGNVPEITKALEIGGNVLLEWDPAVDIDIERYEWRYGPTSGFTWAAATLIDRPDGLRAWFPGLPVGTWRFAVKAIDSVGNYSPTETTVDLTVTTDANAFLQDREFTSPTLTNMVAIAELEGVNKERWATAVGSDAFTAVEPNPFNSGGSAAVISYHASASQKFQGEAWDLGTEAAGTWQLKTDVTAINGSAAFDIEHSDDNVTWTTESGVTTWQGSARYVRPVIRAATTSTIVINAPPKMSLSAITHSENGSGTSAASGARTISLTGKYVKAASIVVQPRGTVARIAVVDNVVLSPTGSNSFDVYIFDAAGVQQATAFDWKFEGF